MTDRVYYSREAEVRAQQRQFILVVVATVFSMTIGAVIALLLAPRRGDEFRRVLGDQIEGVVGAGQKFADQVRQQVEDHVAEARR